MSHAREVNPAGSKVEDARRETRRAAVPNENGRKYVEACHKGIRELQTG
jgi:hypothetical protein